MEQSKNSLFSGALIAMIGVVIGAMAVSNGAPTSAYNGANIRNALSGPDARPSYDAFDRREVLRLTDGFGTQRVDGSAFRDAHNQRLYESEDLHGSAPTDLIHMGDSPTVIRALYRRCVELYEYTSKRFPPCVGNALNGDMLKGPGTY